MPQKDSSAIGNALKKLNHYPHWLLKYPMKCAPAVPAEASLVDFSTCNEPASWRMEGRGLAVHMCAHSMLDPITSASNAK